MEIWKDIDNYNGYYQVSNLGRVRSLDRYIKNRNGYRLKKGQLLKPAILKNGYSNHRLWKDNKLKNLTEHRLVAIAFIPNPNNYKEVNHLNGDKLDNRIENLEWVTRSENIIHSYETGLQKPKKSKVTEDVFIKICFEIENGEKIGLVLDKYNCSNRVYNYRKKHGYKYKGVKK